MKPGFFQIAAVAAFAAGVCGTASAEWTKTYVVDWYEPAMYYGAPSGLTDPGTDCPAGTNPEIDWVKVLVRAGYTEAEARWLRNPANPSREPNHGQNQMAFRGKNRENVYTQPWTMDDPGMKEVSGKIAEGFNLDGKAETGFVSPTGEKGIDNAYYHAMGCTKSLRGTPRLSSGAISTNDTMHNGGWTIVAVLHGAGNDPMNDETIDIGFYMSRDKLVKDGNGAISPDYTFRIKPSKLEGIAKARSVNGVISTKSAVPEFWMRDPGGARDLQLLNARLSLKLNADGSLEGHIGGYRPWMPIYTALVNARGTIVEVLGWIELPAVYYALKRNADYSPAGAGGEKTHISYALRVHAIPAFVMTPDASKEMSAVTSYRANYPASDDVPPPPAFGAIDGLIQRPGLPVGNALEVYPVPQEAAAKPGANGGQ